MTLTVRLDATLEAALSRYCTERGVTKSLVVQESLAVYLVAGRPPGAAVAGAADVPVNASTNYRAFFKAGLIGAVAQGGRSADKQGVRDKLRERLGSSSRASVATLPDLASDSVSDAPPDRSSGPARLSRP